MGPDIVENPSYGHLFSPSDEAQDRKQMRRNSITEQSNNNNNKTSSSSSSEVGKMINSDSTNRKVNLSICTIGTQPELPLRMEYLQLGVEAMYDDRRDDER